METANILICEDERLIARDLELALKRNGYSVVGIAGNAEQAIKLAKETSPDLALMDIQLEGSMNGVAVAGVLAEEMSIPSIFLTAYADAATVEEAKATQPLSYLLKPFDEAALRVAIETGLYRHREQKRITGALQASVQELRDPQTIEKAVLLERQFMKAEQTSALLRVAGNIGQQLEERLLQIQSVLEQISSDTSLEGKHRNSLQGALIHQDRAMQVIERLLRCAADKNLALEELPAEVLIREAISEIRSLVPPGFNFIEKRAESEAICLADRSLAREAIMNVLLNACQAMAKEGDITITTTRTYEDFPERFNSDAAPGWYAEIRIDDTGKGISPEKLDRIFEPCFNASGIPMNPGLGLSVVFGIMQVHQGWVQVESLLEQGTSVYLYFPCLTPEAE